MMPVIVAEGAPRRGVRGAPHGRLRRARGARRAPSAPEWAAPITGVPADRIAALARRYAATRPAMIVARRELDAQGRERLAGRRARSRCLPALDGRTSAWPGAASARGTAAASHGQALIDITRARAPAAGRLRPEPDAARHRSARRRPRPGAAALRDRHAVLVRGRRRAGEGARAHGSRGEPRPLPERHRAAVRRRRAAGDLAGSRSSAARARTRISTSCRRSLDAPGETRPAVWILRELARRLGRRRTSTPGPPTRARSTRSSTIRRRVTPRWPPSAPRAASARCGSRTSPIPTHAYATPSGKVELYSERAAALGLPPLPVHEPAPAPSPSAGVPARAHAHPVPRLLRSRPRAADAGAPRSRAALWIAPADAEARGLVDGAPDPHLQRAGRVRRPGPRDGARAGRDRLDARRLDRAQRRDLRRRRASPTRRSTCSPSRPARRPSTPRWRSRRPRPAGPAPREARRAGARQPLGRSSPSRSGAAPRRGAPRAPGARRRAPRPGSRP